jgi:membrane protease YdiL (CAAX protease family)
VRTSPEYALVALEDGSPAVTRAQAAAELTFWLCIATGYVVSSLLQVPVRFVVLVLGAAIAGYGVCIWKRGRERLRHFGLGRGQLRGAAIAVGLFTGICAAAFVGIALARGVPVWRPELALLLPLYCIYGLAQQLVVQGVFHRRVLALTRSPAAAVAVTGAAFGLLHSANPPLFFLTLGGGTVWALLYQRYPNLWPFGVSHGVLASLAYLLLLDQSPLARL